ncbi:MAG: hypothetical protein RQ722_10280, partial [Desulfuromonadales bacterium]|nr:hypothetical protein [Desulfuromonadales bacterium]
MSGHEVIPRVYGRIFTTEIPGIAPERTKERVIMSLNSFKTRQTMEVAGTVYEYFSLETFAAGRSDVKRLPLTLKVLLENLLRNEDGNSVTKGDVNAVVEWLDQRSSEHEIAFRPARVLMQDFTG